MNGLNVGINTHSIMLQVGFESPHNLLTSFQSKEEDLACRVLYQLALFKAIFPHIST
jgi:hypothetical protein